MKSSLANWKTWIMVDDLHSSIKSLTASNSFPRWQSKINDNDNVEPVSWTSQFLKDHLYCSRISSSACTVEQKYELILPSLNMKKKLWLHTGYDLLLNNFLLNFKIHKKWTEIKLQNPNQYIRNERKRIIMSSSLKNQLFK